MFLLPLQIAVTILRWLFIGVSKVAVRVALGTATVPKSLKLKLEVSSKASNFPNPVVLDRVAIALPSFPNFSELRIHQFSLQY